MSIINKIEHIFSAVLATLVMTATLTGCVDDLIDESVEIPDAEVEIRGEVIYRPLVSTKVQTRAGDAPEGTRYTNINSLYVFFFDKDRQLVGDYCEEVTFNDASKPENSDKRVTFKKRVKAGQYYVYAVANIPEEMKGDLEKVTTIDELRKFKLTWNNDISKDLEMFGVFKNDSKESPSTPKNDSFEEDALITITPQQKNLHSWVRRAVSKVTVDFDGTNLKEGVTVYIKNAVLKNVASATLLGSPSKIGDDGIEIGTTDYSLTYGNGESHESWQSVVTKGKKFSPKEIWQDSGIEDFHDDNARALPCYENLQGEPEGKSKLQDKDRDGKIDSEECDGVVNGTYLEVEGYYVSNRSEYKSEGEIIYRFMLGKNAENNFDVVRNHHYKITMMFKGYGNDVDWHIEYSEKYLDVTYPEDVNYQGRFFVPNADITGGTDYLANGGHTFNEKNVITVTSYETDGTNNTWVTPDITYTYYSYNEQTGNWDKDDSGNWLTETEGTLSEDKTQKKYTFVASMSNPTSCTVNSLFPTTSVGSETSPHNLSNNKGKSTIENTANCYMVGSPGWYSIPLVYGNAITNGQTNGDAYASTNIVNHLNNKISTPYITENTGVTLSNVSVKLIWQDTQDLIIPSSIKYDASLFGGKGGIKFQISQIKEGNAVIALIDNNASEDEYVDIERKTYGKHGSTKAVWSWHIWATRFGFDDFGKDIRILNHDEKAFDVMPVNLGWCSGDKEIRYYKRRKCEITFKVGEQEITRTIEQYPHLVLPRGDHPYYQWGRKDPFVGTNTAYGNKERWTADVPQNCGTGNEYNPPRLYQETDDELQYNEGRKHTKDCLDVLVKNPDKWHNAPRKPDPSNPPYMSINESFSDLWSNNGKKTVYDPCPPGYQVGSSDIFTGFTSTGGNAMYPKNWYDVLESNMEQGYYSDGSINGQVIEFYTDTRKLQSIAFPVTGYRDYDSKAEVMQYPNGGANGQGFAWTNTAKDQTNSYHLKIERKDITSDWQNRGTIIAPLEGFYNTDGFGVRPVATSSMK